MMPEMRILTIGRVASVEVFLLHPSLRNTIHALYMVLHRDSTSETETANIRLPPVQGICSTISNIYQRMTIQFASFMSKHLL